MQGQDALVSKMNEIIAAVNHMNYVLVSMDAAVEAMSQRGWRKYDGPAWVAPTRNVIEPMENMPMKPGSVEPVEYDDEDMGDDAELIDLPSGWNK